MRALFTCQPAISHLEPLALVAREVRAAGHEVAFAVAPPFVPVVRRRGFECFPIGLDWLMARVEEQFPALAGLSPERQGDYIPRQIFGDATTAAALPEMMGLVRTWRPQVIVRETWEFAGWLAAESQGLPHATVGIGIYLSLQMLRRLLGNVLERHRRSIGLPPDPAFSTLYRHLYLHPVPAVFQPCPALPTARAIGALLGGGDPEDGGMDEELRRPPLRPRVLLTMGTVFNRTPGLFRQLIAGVAAEPIELVVTVGRNLEPRSLGPQPPHVRLRSFVRQSEIQASCAAVIHHGGFSTTMTALCGGVPQVVAPIIPEQALLALRCEQLGVGRAVDPNSRAAGGLAAALRQVLGDPACAERAKRVAREAVAGPGPALGARLIAELAARPPAVA